MVEVLGDCLTVEGEIGVLVVTVVEGEGEVAVFFQPNEGIVMPKVGLRGFFWGDGISSFEGRDIVVVLPRWIVIWLIK